MSGTHSLVDGFGIEVSGKGEALGMLNLPLLIHGDVLEGLVTLPRNTFSLIISSPPYNIGKQYEKRVALATYLEWQRKVLCALVPLLKEDGSLCWQTGNFVDGTEVFPLDIYCYPILKELGLTLRNRIVWHFNHGLHAAKRFSGRYETVLWFTKSDRYTFNLDAVRVPHKYPGKKAYKGKNKGQLSGNPLGKNPSDFWEGIQSEFENGVIDVPNVKANHPEKTVHPCQFPVELVERFVLALTNERDWVLDPFCGVGSTLIAAFKNHRKAVGVDWNEEYLDVGRQRLEALQQGTLKLRPLGTPIYEPKRRI
jgi:DNA modification methylase